MNRRTRGAACFASSQASVILLSIFKDCVAKIRDRYWNLYDGFLVLQYRGILDDDGGTGTGTTLKYKSPKITNK